MNFDTFKEYGRTLCIRFECDRCKQVAYRTVDECRPTDYETYRLANMVPPADWHTAGRFDYLLCPECSKKFDAFMKGEPVE